MNDLCSIRISNIARLLIVFVCLTNILPGRPVSALADDPVRIELTDRVPYGRKPVDYFSSGIDDAVAGLQRRIESGKIRLSVDDRFGYLPAVLKHLDVPVESQVLVYSKTARAPDLVSPKTPRAIYFNDEVSVAWIPQARELEITAIDPLKGINFYTLSQPFGSASSDGRKRSSEIADGESPAKAIFLRRDRCLACHAGRSTLEVPGLLLRAFQTDRTGKPIVGFSRVTHEMRYEKRWGGWFVTGAPKGVTHRGNLLGEDDNTRHRKEPGFASSLDDLSGKFDVANYPYPKSDFLAHLVLTHQVHGTNLLIRTGMEARLNRRSDVGAELLRYMVFADEPPLELSSEAAVAARMDSKFAAEFESRGPHDATGNSLRKLSLDGRVFKHRLSFLIYSRLFDELPDECRSRLLKRLWEGLNSLRTNENLRHLEPEERRSIIAIVRATVPRLPKCWNEKSAVLD